LLFRLFAVTLSFQWHNVLIFNCHRIYTEYTQKNGAVSIANKKFISHLTTYTVSSGNCPSFSCAASSSLLKLTAGPRGQFPRWRRSRKRRSVSVSEKTHLRCVFSKPCTKLTLHCNHRSGHLKTEHTESLFLPQRHLGNWPRGPAVSIRSELLVAHEKLGQLLLLTVYFVPV